MSKNSDGFDQVPSEDSGTFEVPSEDSGTFTVPEEISVSATLRVLHLRAIHAIRKFTVEGGFNVVVGRKNPLKPYEELADGCRDAIASAAYLPPDVVHCTISYCGGKKTSKPTASRKVWNFAQSTTDTDRPLLLGPDNATIVGKNSGFAALLSCRDSENIWRFRFPCFACDDLTKIPKYVDNFPNWDIWYHSRLVFPLRFRTRDVNGSTIDNITGFLSFDSRMKNVFNVPSIFAYMNDPVKYGSKLEKLDLCNAGGIIADCIATAILQEKRRLMLSKKLKGVKDVQKTRDNSTDAQAKGPV